MADVKYLLILTLELVRPTIQGLMYLFDFFRQGRAQYRKKTDKARFEQGFFLRKDNRHFLTFFSFWTFSPN